MASHREQRRSASRRHQRPIHDVLCFRSQERSRAVGEGGGQIAVGVDLAVDGDEVLFHPGHGVGAGGTRLYSSRDVEKLRQIAALTDTGINIAGIKRVLELQDEVRRLKPQIQRMDTKIKRQTP